MMSDDFDLFFEEFEKIRRRLIREFFEEDIDKLDVERLEKDGWVIKKINGPGTHGFVARRVVTNTFPNSGGRIKELKSEDILYDIYDQGDFFEIYIDLPGEKEEDILVSADENWIIVETSNLRKKIYLKSKIDPDTLVKKYINGVLKISLKKLV